jgi:hypothetical protein
MATSRLVRRSIARTARGAACRRRRRARAFLGTPPPTRCRDAAQNMPSAVNAAAGGGKPAGGGGRAIATDDEDDAAAVAKAIALSLEDAERATRAAAAGHDDEALARSLGGEHQGHHLLDEDAQFARDMEMAWKIKDEEASAAQQAEKARLARRAAAEAEDERLARALMESQTLEARAPRARREMSRVARTRIF